MNTQQLQDYLEQKHSVVALSPTETNSSIEKLLDILDVEFTPEIVPVAVEPYSKEKSCYYNVEEKVKRDGGKIHYGWTVWQSPYLCEAEHHSVWENEQGDFLDITPREREYETIMFIPDSDKVFTGKTYPNVRINTTANPIVDDLILAFNTIDKLWLFGDRRNIYQVMLPQVVAEYIGTPESPGLISAIAHNTELYYLTGARVGSKCYCNSGKTYAKCHSAIIKQQIQECITNVSKHLG